MRRCGGRTGSGGDGGRIGGDDDGGGDGLQPLLLVFLSAVSLWWKTGLIERMC